MVLDWMGLRYVRSAYSVPNKTAKSCLSLELNCKQGPPRGLASTLNYKKTTCFLLGLNHLYLAEAGVLMLQDRFAPEIKGHFFYACAAASRCQSGGTKFSKELSGLTWAYFHPKVNS
jgi:hypothetical protein